MHRTLAIALLCVFACDQDRSEDHHGSNPDGLGTSPGGEDPGQDPSDDPGDDTPDTSSCEASASAYMDLSVECFPSEFDPVSDDDVAQVCDLSRTPESVWVFCEDEVDAFTACGDAVGCVAWYGTQCWTPYREMMICFGEDDPGAQAPECSYTDDGECDEPEGTGYCWDGTDVSDCSGSGGGGDPAPSCDPDACSGCETACDDFGCYQCCWSCSGSSCEQSCNF